jgi:hypothetical protein
VVPGGIDLFGRKKFLRKITAKAIAIKRIGSAILSGIDVLQ